MANKNDNFFVQVIERMRELQDTHEYGKVEAENGQLVCFYCRKPIEIGYDDADHVTPKSKHGTDKGYNRVYVCRHCNASKNAKDPIEYLLAKAPELEDDEAIDLIARILMGRTYYVSGFSREYDMGQKAGAFRGFITPGTAKITRDMKCRCGHKHGYITVSPVHFNISYRCSECEDTIYIDAFQYLDRKR